MQHALRVSPDEECFVVKTAGQGSVSGIAAFLKDILAHPRWKPGKSILLDHRDLRIDNITASQVDEVSAFFKTIADQLGTGKIVLVMGRDVDFGVARSWEIVTGDDVGIEIRVVREMAKATEWLGIVAME